MNVITAPDPRHIITLVDQLVIHVRARAKGLDYQTTTPRRISGTDIVTYGRAIATMRVSKDT